MKKLLTIAALVISLAGVARSEDYLQGVVGPFGGLNNSDNSLVIPATQAQDLLNVDITPGGKSVKKRKGFAQAFATSITTSPIHGVYTFYDESGNDVVLSFNDRNVTASVAGGAATVIYSTATNDATWQCVDSQGFAYCANTARDALFFTDGVSLGTLPVASTGTIVAVTTERLAQAGFSATPNRIDISAANDFETWTVGADPTDPITFTITAPGSRITHLVYAHKKLYWFKESSFGYIIEGDTLDDWTVRAVSNEIGTLDNTSTQDTNGSLYFRGQDGHIYVTDGANVSKLSNDIENSVNAVSSQLLNSWTQSTESDFESGSITDLESNLYSGDLKLVLGSVAVKDSCYDADSASDTATCSFLTNSILRSFTASSSYVVTSVTVRIVKSASGSSPYTLTLYSDSSNEPNVSLVSTSIANGLVSTSVSDVTFTFDTPYILKGGTRYWIQVSKGCSSDFTTFSWYYPSPTCDSSEYYKRNFNASSTATGRFKYKANGKSYGSPGVYASQVKNAPNLTAWDNFSTEKVDNGGTHSFYIRAATESFTVGSSTPSWTSISNGDVPSISTGTYFQIKDEISTTDTSLTPTLSEISQNWIEGSADDKSYSFFHDDKVMFSVTSGEGQTTNNRVLVYDLITPGWTIYDLAANGFYRRNNSLYFGSSGGGYVYKFGDVDSDNGEAIEAYWKSKDFFLDAPFLEKDFVNISVAASQVSNSSMTVTYTVNGSSSNAYTVPLGNAGSTFVRNNKNLPAGRFGTTFSVQFGNDAEDQSFEVFGVGFGYRPRSWRPFP